MISQAHKSSLIQKALSHPGCNLRLLAQEGNVGYSTLHKWLKQHKSREIHTNESTSSFHSRGWSRTQRMQIVLECATLDDESLGRYCREKGLYPSQITEWKGQLMSENPQAALQEQKRIQQRLEAENKLLKKELSRKDKALAEASALLILKKKADLIWSEVEDD
jgi:transposase-like protein